MCAIFRVEDVLPALMERASGGILETAFASKLTQE